MKIMTLLFAGLFSISTLEGLPAQSPSGGRMPLDLPSGGKGEDDPEEDILEVIHFWGNEYEGDAFFWCLDKSGSMYGESISKLKQEFTSTMLSLSSEAEFGVVAFSSGHVALSTAPLRAESENKEWAIDWVQQLLPDGSTRRGPAMIETLNLANQSSKSGRQILVLSDGFPGCYGMDTSEQVLADVRNANYERIPVNTIYISSNQDGSYFMQMLAAQNNGTFHQPQ